MKKKLVCSSEVYELNVEDLLKLPKSDDYCTGEEVIVFLGNIKHGENDALMSGQETLLDAQKAGKKFVETKMVYRSYDGLSGFLINLLKYVKRNNYQRGRGSFRMSFANILDKDLPRGERNFENAYALSSNVSFPEENKRQNAYLKLYNSIKENGYDMKYPIIILLNRKFGVKDQLLQGHHRIGICKELGIEEISVSFWGGPRSFGFMMIIYKFLRLFRKK
ncbi:MAG: hypothetical protein PHE89_05275 [Alphaproteobacteria bacterium]|nr:hypothetical protein [Alphaproteobacteria bacterium]